jgi:hypothetical protein
MQRRNNSGESIEDRAGMLVALSTLNPQPESVPLMLCLVEGTSMEEENQLKFGRYEWYYENHHAETAFISR